jgi:hypothetical protein
MALVTKVGSVSSTLILRVLFYFSRLESGSSPDLDQVPPLSSAAELRLP